MSDFTSFLERKQQLLETVTRLIEIVEAELNSQDIERLHHFKQGLIEDLTFKMLCIGDFSSGKSTFINRFLLQQDILPAFPKPTTTRPTKIRYGESLKAQLFFQNGSKEEVFENVAERLLETVSTGGRDVEQVSHVILESPSTILQDGIELVDAPGLNDPDAERMKITFDYLHQADAILFFLNAQQPWTRYQKTFFEQNLLEKQDIDKLFIVANYWDQIESGEREDVLEYLEEQLQASLRQLGDGNDKKPIDLHILPVSSKTGENGEAVKQSIWNYLGNRKFSDVLASRVQRLNSYIDSYTKYLDEQITLVKLDRSSKEKKRITLEREIASYKKLRDQFVIDLKQFLKPEFEEYRSTVEDLFVNLSRKMRTMMLQLNQENIAAAEINSKLSIRLSRLQNEQTREMQLKEVNFLERIKAIIEEQKGMIEVPSNNGIHIDDYYLKWERISNFDSLQTTAVASGALGVAGLLVGAGTILQTLAAPVVSKGAIPIALSWLTTGSATAVSSTMAFGLPAIVVGTIAIASSIYLKHRSSQENARQLADLADQLEETINQEKRKIIGNMTKNQTQNIEAICKEVDHEINQIYRQKLEELDRIDLFMDHGAYFEALYKMINTMRMKVNP